MRFFITPKFPPGYFVAITLWPVGIFFNSSGHYNNNVIRRHEKIHWEQQKEMLGIFFYLWYGIEYLIKLIRYKDTYKAYREISFEKEAKYFETGIDYLRIRDRYFWRYFL